MCVRGGGGRGGGVRGLVNVHMHAYDIRINITAFHGIPM